MRVLSTSNNAATHIVKNVTPLQLNSGCNVAHTPTTHPTKEDIYTLKRLMVLKTPLEHPSHETKITGYGCTEGVVCHTHPNRKISHTLLGIMTTKLPFEHLYFPSKGRQSDINTLLYLISKLPLGVYQFSVHSKKVTPLQVYSGCNMTDTPSAHHTKKIN